jgi:hypothetical protein
LTKFDISENELRAEGGMTLAAGLKGNQVITELNITSNALGLKPNGLADTSGVAAIADVIGDMGALMKFDISSNGISVDGTKLFAEELRGNQIMTELNISCNGITDRAGYIGCNDMSGVTALANVIPGMRAISTVIVNTFPLPIQDIKSKAELDFSGKGLNVEDAVIIAALIPLNVSRTTFPQSCYR